MGLQFPGLSDYVRKEIKNKTPVELIFNYSKEKFGYNKNFETFKVYCNHLRGRSKIKERLVGSENISDTLLKLLSSNGYFDKIDVAKQLGIQKQSEFDSLIEKLRSLGHEIITVNNKLFLSKNEVMDINDIPLVSDSDEIMFGVASDLHFGSKACQITALNEFCNICRNKGVKHIFSPGDILTGTNTYPGQIFDVYAVTADEQENSCIQNLPEGFHWYMLGGNHDYSFIKKGGGHNPLPVIASRRNDVTYIGYDDVTIPLLKNVDVKLWHPSGGVPYALSYRLQKGVEQIAFDELRNIVRGVKDRPTIRFVLGGHLHIQMQAMFGSIFGAQCGAFEGTTNYLKQKGLVPSIGGYIIKATLGKNSGLLKSFEAKFYLFDEIEDDWKNYNHTLPDDNTSKVNFPIFG